MLSVASYTRKQSNQYQVVCVCAWGVSQHGSVVCIYSKIFEIVSHEVYGNKDCECLFLFADSISFRLSFLTILIQFDDTSKREQEIFDKYVNYN